MPPGAGERDLPQRLGIEVLLLGLDVVLARALLHSDLADALVDSGRIDHARSLLDPEGERLFHVDVFARVEGVDGDRSVPVVGRGDQNGIDLLKFQQLRVIGEALGLGGLLLARLIWAS